MDTGKRLAREARFRQQETDLALWGYISVAIAANVSGFAFALQHRLDAAHPAQMGGIAITCMLLFWLGLCAGLIALALSVASQVSWRETLYVASPLFAQADDESGDDIEVVSDAPKPTFARLEKLHARAQFLLWGSLVGGSISVLLFLLSITIALFAAIQLSA